MHKKLRFLPWSALFIVLCVAITLLWRTRTDVPKGTSSVVIDTTVLRNGDLLFRTGYGIQSGVVLRLSGGVYSHIAMAYHSPHGWVAVHAVPGETDDGQDQDWLKAEPITTFYCSERAACGAIARVDCDTVTARKAVEYALDKVRSRLTFDHGYDLQDTSRYYCTELVYRAYLSQGIDLCNTAAVPCSSENGVRKYLYPDDIFTNAKVLWRKKLSTNDN